MSFNNQNNSNVPPHVVETLREMPAEYAAIAPPRDVLESLTPDRMVTMDFTMMQLIQRAQESGSPQAMQEADLICQRLKVLEKAHMQFSMRPSWFQESNLNFERLYHELYKDILKYESVWFEKVYPLDPKYSERCVGILGTLATILRQRGEVDECIEILNLDVKCLKCYQDLSALPNTPRGQIDCCRGLTYKYHQIRVNAHNEKGHKEQAVVSFKECVKYEIEEGYTFDQQNWAFILPMTFGVNHQRQLERVSDDQMWETLQTMQARFGGHKSALHEHVQLRKCIQCGKAEEKRGDHKVCSKCKVPVYCGRQCQRVHWKIHKKQCCK